jgi:polyisoprenoid-binding protein YceI
MDKNMNKTLKTEQHPKITFVLEKVKSITPKGNSYEIKADGKLTIAGTTKTISMTVSGQPKGNDIVFKGSQQVKMTDYNVEPPVMMLGTLKTANEVTINYEVTFSNAGISMN